MTTSSHIEAAASVLAESRRLTRPCCPISERFGITSVEDAYAVQEINTQKALTEGARLVGRKIGLTSTVVQQQLGVNQPDFGMLFAHMEYMDGDEIDTTKLISPKIEGEIAFVLDSDLTQENLTFSELVNSIAYALPALEIVDSAIENWKITIADTIADNASAAAYVLGKTPISIQQLDLTLEGMLLNKNHQIASMGVGAACLGHPLNACYWLAHKMVEFGHPLKAGDVILSGALGPMVPVAKGDYLQLQLTRLGTISCHFI